MFDLLSTLPESWNQMSGEPLAVIENENGVYVKGLSCHLAQNEEEALNLLFEVFTPYLWFSLHFLHRYFGYLFCSIELNSLFLYEKGKPLSNLAFSLLHIFPIWTESGV